MAVFQPRTTKPEAGNKYYITKANGGYSDAIKGNPTDKDCDVLANCVGYAYGRFNEIGGYGYCKYLRPVNAENFIQYAGGLEVGQTPRVGACMVWKKGATLGGSDGAGHVAIVEKVISDTQIVTSESGYGSASPFWTKTRNKGDGNWGAGAGYTFLGFIYNPAPCCQNADAPVKPKRLEGLPLLKLGAESETVRALQILLIGNGISCGKHGADGEYGPDTKNAVECLQEKMSAQGIPLEIDGECGPETWAAAVGLR